MAEAFLMSARNATMVVRFDDISSVISDNAARILFEIPKFLRSARMIEIYLDDMDEKKKAEIYKLIREGKIPYEYKRATVKFHSDVQALAKLQDRFVIERKINGEFIPTPPLTAQFTVYSLPSLFKDPNVRELRVRRVV